MDRTYNAAELQEVMAAKDADLSNTELNASAFTDTWAAHDAPTEAQWWTAWAQMRDGYNVAREHAQRYLDLLDLTLLSLTDYDATYEYTNLLQALNANWPTAPYAAGSFDDLQGRLQTAETSLGFIAPPPAPIPQPNPSNDSGVNPSSWMAYATGAAWQLGLLQNPPPPGTPGTAGGPPLIPTWIKWAAGAGLALFGLDILAKVKE